MDAIKAQLLRMQQQLQGLNSSQRMLAGSLVVIMVMTMLYWGRYASAPEMVPLLTQTFSADETAQIVRMLDEKGVQYLSSGDKIMVPVDRKTAILGELSLNGFMPSDTHKGYEDMLKLDNQWNTNVKSEGVRTDAKARYLAKIIGTWQDVAAANVIIDATNERRVGGGRVPTATVQIKTRNGAKLHPKAAKAAVALVTGAQSGLEEKNVKVVINDLAAKVNTSADGMFDSDELQELQFKIAAEYSERITSHLNIPGVLVAVGVAVENQTKKTSKITYDKNGIAKANTSETSETAETKSAAGAGREAGAVANTQVTLDPPAVAPAENTTSREKTDSKSENRFSSEQMDILSPGGAARVTGASVRVPRSYFSQVWKSRNPGKPDPDEIALETLIKAEIPDIIKAVRACANTQTEEAVVVAPYSDLAPINDPTALGSAGTAGVTVMLGGHVKEIAMGALALMSLFMVSMIVKKSAPIPAIIRPTEVMAPQQIDGGEELFGIAGASAGTLDALELGDEEVRAQQVVEQVSGLVKENPDAAAALVKRWLNK